MDGLIPMVFRSLKRTKTRRKYECLSTGESYNIADFYVKDDDLDSWSQKQNEQNKVPGLGGAYHRRNQSVHVDHHLRSLGFGEDAAKRQQLVRFRSHRIFSCVTGA